jgi:hypothetical protein
MLVQHHYDRQLVVSKDARLLGDLLQGNKVAFFRAKRRVLNELANL